MTEEKLRFAINLKQNIAIHEEDLDKLVRYKSDVKFHKMYIIDYFCNYPLYNPSLHQTLEDLLDKEIDACRRCIIKEKEALLKL